MDTGYIKLFRKMVDWKWIDNPDVLSVWINLLIRANIEDRDCKGIIVRRGQVLASRSMLARWCGLSERTVRTCISRLQATSEVTIEPTSETTSRPTNKPTIITICKFESYQDKRPANRPAERPTERPANRPANRPIEKEESKETSILTNVRIDAKKGGPSEEFVKFEDWIARNAPRVAAMSQPFTEEQFDELRAEFDAKAVSDILEEMQNWTDLPRRVSAFLTCRSWLRKRQTNKTNQPHANNRINRPAGAAVSQYGNYGEGTI